MIWGTLFMLAAMQTAGPADVGTIVGDWHHADLRSIEVLVADGGCIRAWLEERTYALQTDSGGRVSGAYRSVIRAMPVSMSSLRPACKFPPPTENPIAYQTRMWLIAGTLVGENTWQIQARPARGGGDFDQFKTEAFTARLRVDGKHLLHSGGDAHPIEEPREFRRPALPPADARRALEEVTQRLEDGGCLAVYSDLPAFAVDGPVRVCAVRRQAAALMGRRVSVTIVTAVEIDRIYRGFPLVPELGFERRRGVLFTFTTEYEHARIPGHALLIQENGTWRIISVWY